MHSVSKVYLQTSHKSRQARPTAELGGRAVRSREILIGLGDVAGGEEVDARAQEVLYDR